MAHQPSSVTVQPVSRPTFADLICVVVLGVVLWLTAQSVGGVARSSTVHPASTPHGAADCTTPPAPEHTVAQANPLAPITGECADAKTPAAAH
jgi:hypothetical protein